MRISRPHMFMQMAEVAAMRSTCFRANVGAVVVKDNDVLSIGYNGPPSGEPHCQGNECALTSTGGCERALHAERNALHRARRKASALVLPLADLYCTYSPCLDCAKLITATRVSRFFYRHSYRVKDGLEFLLTSRVAVYKITTAGLIVRESDNKLIDL